MVETEKKLDESKEKIIKDFFEKKDNSDFKGFKIQAGPGTGKTFLLKKILERLSNELKEQNISAISFSNSAIDTISSKLGQKNNNIGVQTIASFFIENFIIPFSYSILKNENLNQDQKNLLQKISNTFSENNIANNPEWNTLNGITKTFCKDNYFNLFHNIILQKNIRYIFIDEYQDTQDYCIEIFKKIIEKGKIKLFCVGDKNQQINFEEDKNAFDGLYDKHSLETTYRFGQDILNYTNKVLDSGIKEPNEKNSVGNIQKLDYKSINGTEDQRLKNLCEFVIKFIQENNSTFYKKSNAILFQPATDEDYQFGKKFNGKLEESLNDNDEIIFSYTEKPVYNIHLKSFFEKTIAFVNGNENIRYSEIEKELDFFYEKGEKKENFKNIFFEVLKFKETDKIKKVGSLLLSGFKSGGKHKKYFEEIIKLLEKQDFTFKEAENKQLIDLIDRKKDDKKIYISTNTITSAKGKEYDNIIVLNIYNGKSFHTIINEKGETKEIKDAKKHYYVAVSRAKENIFTFVDYGFDSV